MENTGVERVSMRDWGSSDPESIFIRYEKIIDLESGGGGGLWDGNERK